MTVATALAVSWNPLTNSKLSASPSASNRKMAFPVERVSPNSCIHAPHRKIEFLGYDMDVTNVLRFDYFFGADSMLPLAMTPSPSLKSQPSRR